VAFAKDGYGATNPNTIPLGRCLGFGSKH